MSSPLNAITGIVETGFVAGVALKSLELTGNMFSNMQNNYSKPQPKKESIMPKKKHNNAFDFSSFDNPFDFRF